MLGPRFARRRPNLKRPFTPLNWPAMPPNPGKHLFRQSPSFHFSTANFFFRIFFWPEKKFGRVFCQDLEGLTFFGRLQQIAEGFLLQIQLLSGLYGSWSRKYHLTPHHLPPTPTPHRPTNPPTPPGPKNKPTTFRRILTNVPRCVSNSFQSVYFSGRL